MPKGYKPMDADRKAEGVALLDRVDPYSHVRNKLRGLAAEREDWAGIPIPVNDMKMVIEPTFPYAGLNEYARDKGESGYKIRNIFWSHKKGCRVAIAEDENGQIFWAPLLGSSNSATALLNTIGASDAWGIEQESTAINLLAELVGHRKFKQYMLTGMFIETSKRSGISYVFRRLRPTIAITPHHPDGNLKILCTLCMHPIGYYEESWAGCMCPTDDVIAHLMLMRSDEKMFWKRSAQHPPYDSASGL